MRLKKSFFQHCNVGKQVIDDRDNVQRATFVNCTQITRIQYVNEIIFSSRLGAKLLRLGALHGFHPTPLNPNRILDRRGTATIVRHCAHAIFIGV